MASDFAISRFQHLRKLMLVHGHWCYSRLANMILYFIYKNVVRVHLQSRTHVCVVASETCSWSLLAFTKLTKRSLNYH